MNKKALIYCRVSSIRQKTEGHGLDSQELRCREYAGAKGYEVEKVFQDSFSGGGDFMKRPGMAALLGYVDSKPHQEYVVIFDDLSRFARDVVQHIRLKQEFGSRKIQIECPNFNFDDTPENEVFELNMAVYNQYFRKNNTRNVIKKQKDRLLAGYWPFRAIKPYEMVKDPLHGKILTPQEPYASRLKEALEGYATDKYLHKVDACRYLVEQGFWTRQKPEKYIEKFTEICRNPLFAGFIEWSKWEVDRRPGQHEAIISLETFNAIQDKLQKKAKAHRKDANPDHYMRGLVVCAECGGHMSTAKSKSKSGKGHDYYFCQGNKGCPLYKKSVRLNDVHEGMDTILKGITVDQKTLDFAQLVFEDEWNQQVKDVKKRSRDQEKRAGALEEKKDKLVDLIVNASNDTLRSGYEKSLEKIIAEIENSTVTPVNESDLENIYRTSFSVLSGLLKSPYSIWSKVDSKEKHRLFNFIFDEKLAYSKNQGYRTPKKALPTRLFGEIGGVEYPLCGDGGNRTPVQT